VRLLAMRRAALASNRQKAIGAEAEPSNERVRVEKPLY
jgi:hypothetical protein